MATVITINPGGSLVIGAGIPLSADILQPVSSNTDLTLHGNGTGKVNIVNTSDNTKKLIFDPQGSANTATTITCAQTGDQTLTLPSVGSASFVMTEGVQSINGDKTFNGSITFSGSISLGTTTDNQRWISYRDIDVTAGVWTATRFAQNNWALRNTDSSAAILAVDVPAEIRTTSGKGLILTGLNVVYGITVGSLNILNATLHSKTYANNVAVSLTSVSLNGLLGFGLSAQTNPYVGALTVATPAALNTSNSTYAFELSITPFPGTTFDFYGIQLTYNQAA